MKRAHLIVLAVGVVGVADIARAFAPGRPPVASPELRMPGAEPTDIRRARVRVIDGDGERTCALSDGKHRCGAKGWQYVGEKAQKVGGKRETCVWAHPIEGATIEVTYPSVTSSKDEPLSLSFGVADKVSKKGGPVDVRVVFDGETVTHVHPARRGWSRVKLRDGSGPLRLEISAKKVGQRHLCYRFE